MIENVSSPNSKKTGSRLWILLSIVVGLCLLLIGVIGCLGLSFWGVGAIQDRNAANATGTRQALAARATGTRQAWVANATGTRQARDENATATQQALGAEATATHLALVDERTSFGFVDAFDDNTNGWSISRYDDQFFRGEVKVADGLYTWDILELKQSFMHTGEMYPPAYLTDFDVYVDGIGLQQDSTGFCYGIRFRSIAVMSSRSFYDFLVCDAGFYNIYYRDGAANESLSMVSRQTSSTIRTGVWNTLGIQARGSHLKFLINDWIVDELDDTRLSAGQIGLVVEADGTQPGTISFDNFAIQGR